MARNAPIFKPGRTATTLRVKRIINDLNGPPREGNTGDYWLMRVLLPDGEENTLFVNPPEQETLVAGGCSVGSVFSIVERNGERIVNMATPPPDRAETVSEPPPAENTRARRSSVPAPAARSDGWSSCSFDEKLTPNLREVPTLVDGPQEKIFARLVNGVGDELCEAARAKTLRLVGLDVDSKLTAPQAAALASAAQANFATLVIAWKDLGYPLTPAERARAEHADDSVPAGGEEDIPF